MTEAPSSPRPRRRHTVAWIVVGVAVLLLALAAWVAVRGLLAAGELSAAAGDAARVRSAVTAGDVDAARAAAAELEDHAAAAASLTADPVWRGAELVPSLGANLTCVRMLATTLHDLSTAAVTPLIDVADELSVAAFRPAGGRVDLAPLAAAAPELNAASIALDDADAELRRIAPLTVIGPIADARTRAAVAVAEASSLVATASDAATLLPPMLGADGPRDYLLLAQNNAELRSTGGISGAMAVIHVDDGAISLLQQASTSDFSRFTPPVDAPEDSLGVYGPELAAYIQDANFTPDFPVAAAIARQMWQRQTGTTVDGVIAVDPVAVGHLLSATGPVTLPGGEVITAGDAATTLLSDVYARYPDTRVQDAFFAATAAAVFQAVTSGDAQPAELIRALSDASAERRILVWSAHDVEQSVLSGSTLAGELPSGTDTAPQFGVYFNDKTGAKMDTYLRAAVDIGHAACREDGRIDYRITVTISNDSPADAATSLPAYVTGGGVRGIPPGTIRTDVAVYGSEGYFDTGVTSGGTDVSYQPATEAGRPLSRVATTLAPGESQEYTFGFLVPAGATGAATLLHTPLAGDIAENRSRSDCPAQ